MKDTYKSVIAMVFIPLVAVLGFSEACSAEVVAIVSTLLTGAGVGLWKWSKKV